MPTRILLLPVLALLLGAWVQGAGPTGFDPASKLTEIDAARSEYLDGGKRVISEGAVRVTQPGVILTADRIEVTFVEDTREIEEVLALGRVRYATITGDAIAGDRALYIAADSTFTVTGNVVVAQEAQVSTGEQLIYNTQTGSILMTGGENGRVRALISQADGG